MTDSPTVIDRPDEHRFVYTDDGSEAQLVYRVEEDDHLYLVHTEVPDALGGQGIGGKLVRAAVARAEASGETVHPWCPFARAWLEKHPDEVRGIAIDWAEPDA